MAWDPELEVSPAEAARIIGVSSTYLSSALRKAGLPTRTRLPLRVFVALRPSFQERLERREADRAFVTGAVTKLEQRVALLEAYNRGLSAELEQLRDLVRLGTSAAPMPSPAELEGLPGLTRHRKSRQK